jgi:hypothetical protein
MHPLHTHLDRALKPLRHGTITAEIDKRHGIVTQMTTVNRKNFTNIDSFNHAAQIFFDALHQQYLIDPKYTDKIQYSVSFVRGAIDSMTVTTYERNKYKEDDGTI